MRNLSHLPPTLSPLHPHCVWLIHLFPVCTYIVSSEVEDIVSASVAQTCLNLIDLNIPIILVHQNTLDSSLQFLGQQREPSVTSLHGDLSDQKGGQADTLNSNELNAVDPIELNAVAAKSEDSVSPVSTHTTFESDYWS